MWYREGSVSVTNLDSTVTGTGTAFAANSRVGDGFVGPDGLWYEVINIASDTVLSIEPPYRGVTVSGGDFAIAPIQGYQKGLADAVRELVQQYGAIAASPNLEAFADLTGAAGLFPIFSGAATMETVPSTAFGRDNFLAAVNETGVRGLLDLEKTTSPTDTTAGRLLQVGDFGNGGASPSVANPDLLAAGGDFSATLSGVPTLLSHQQLGADSAFQLLTEPSSDRIRFRRKNLGGAWSAFLSLFHEGNLDPWRDSWATAGGTANAQTLTPVGAGAPTALRDRMYVRTRIVTTNTGPATVNFAGLGAKPCVTVTGVALPASYLRTDVDTEFTYDLAGDRWIVDRQPQRITNAQGHAIRFANGASFFRGVGVQPSGDSAAVLVNLPTTLIDTDYQISGCCGVASGAVGASFVCEFNPSTTSAAYMKVLIHQATTINPVGANVNIRYHGWGFWY